MLLILMSVVGTKLKQESVYLCEPQLSCMDLKVYIYMYAWQRCLTSQNAEQAYLRFMKKCGNDLYIWPTPNNEFWESIDNIMCVFSFPNLVNKREQFNFTAEDEAKVKSYTRANDWI